MSGSTTASSEPLQFLAISGSLRRASSNSILIGALSGLSPSNVQVEVYDQLDELPHFNPDLDADGLTPPAAVADFRCRLKVADAVIISTPEYAHGIPGAIKNALDWVVSSGETVGKPVAIINASPRSTHAGAQLREVLTTMAANVVEAASITVALADKNIEEDMILADAEVSAALLESLEVLLRVIQT